MAWLAETGDWRVSWSTRGGVAEIKTALFRTAHPSDPVPAVRLDHCRAEPCPRPRRAAPAFPFEPPRMVPGGRPAEASEPGADCGSRPAAADGRRGLPPAGRPPATPVPSPCARGPVHRGVGARRRPQGRARKRGASRLRRRPAIGPRRGGQRPADALRHRRRYRSGGRAPGPGCRRMPTGCRVGDWRGAEGLALIDRATGAGRMAVIDPEGLAGLPAERRAALLEALMARFRQVAIVRLRPGAGPVRGHRGRRRRGGGCGPSRPAGRSG